MKMHIKKRMWIQRALTIRRRGHVWVTFLNGRDIGSGGYKRYDDDTALMHYIYIKPRKTYDVQEMTQVLYEELERNMIDEGYKTVFTQASEDEWPFYEKNGFVLGCDRDPKKLLRLYGAVIIDAVTVEKRLESEA